MGRAFRFPSITKSAFLIKGDEGRSIYQEMDQMKFAVFETSQNEYKTLNTLHLILLTCSTGGLQVVWSLIMSNGTPYLITLGLPESLTALVWVVAPLCGVLVQPYVGVLSDRCQIPWGRRRPFILGGTIGCVICMLGLGSSKPTLHLLANLIKADIHGDTVRSLALCSAVAWLLGLNIFIQPLQAGIRALVVDNCPAQQQAEASAWASRITGIGNITGYFFGFVPVHTILPFLKISQFVWLCVVASITLSLSVAVTCSFVKEQDPRTLPAPISNGTSFMATLRLIMWSARTMPRAVRQVCTIQFFAWLGWFPYLFYISSYVGDLYAAPLLAQEVHMSTSMQTKVIEDAVRLGSLASLVFSVFALLTNIVIPMLVKDTINQPRNGITITRAWSFAHLLFSLAMFCTLLVTSQSTAIILAAFVGISWAFTLWVPFAIIGKEVAARQERNVKILEGEIEAAQQDQAGAIMGLHNCAISAPQIIAALVSGLIFWLTPRLGSHDGIGWVMRFGGVGGLIAAWLAARMEI